VAAPGSEGAERFSVACACGSATARPSRSRRRRRSSTRRSSSGGTPAIGSRWTGPGTCSCFRARPAGSASCCSCWKPMPARSAAVSTPSRGSTPFLPVFARRLPGGVDGPARRIAETWACRASCRSKPCCRHVRLVPLVPARPASGRRPRDRLRGAGDDAHRPVSAPRVRVRGPRAGAGPPGAHAGLPAARLGRGARSAPGVDGPQWIWRRIDLGGAYGEPDENVADVPAHVPGLPDPLPWPRGAKPTPSGVFPGAPAPARQGPAKAPSPRSRGPRTRRRRPARRPAREHRNRRPFAGSPAGRAADRDRAAVAAACPARHAAAAVGRPGTAVSSFPPPSTPPETAPSVPVSPPRVAVPVGATTALLDRFPLDATRGETVEVAGRIPDPAGGTRLVELVLDRPGSVRSSWARCWRAARGSSPAC